MRKRRRSRSAGAGRGTALALARRAFRDARVRTIAFVYLFALYAYIQPVGYRHAYPTLADRLAFAHSFAGNKALRLFYGEPHDLLTVSGYTAWRVGGTLAIFAAVFGLARRGARAAHRGGHRPHGARARRDRRRGARPISRRSPRSRRASCSCGSASSPGFIVGGLPAGGSAYLALATVSVVPVFVGRGRAGKPARADAPHRAGAGRRGRSALCSCCAVIADTASGAGWLRWVTPLGWAEQLRPFAGAQPLVLLLPVAASVLLLGARGTDRARPRHRHRRAARPR